MTLSDRLERTGCEQDATARLMKIDWEKLEKLGIIRNGETLKISYTTDSEGNVVAGSVSVEKEPKE